MFYCDKCGKKNKWPTGWAASYGKCEVCGKTATCNDTPSSRLPEVGTYPLRRKTPERETETRK